MKIIERLRLSVGRAIYLGLLTLFGAALVCRSAEAGTFAYVTNSSASSVTVIKTTNNTVVRIISLANSPAQIAVTPESTRAYVTSPTGNAVYLINTVTNTVIGTITVPSAQGFRSHPTERVFT